MLQIFHDFANVYYNIYFLDILLKLYCWYKLLKNHFNWHFIIDQRETLISLKLFTMQGKRWADFIKMS